MFKKSTFFMRVVIFLFGIVVVIPCALSTPSILMIMKGTITSISTQDEPLVAMFYLLFFGAIYFALIPFLIALYQTMLLLGYIDKKEAFSEKSIKALRTIRNCATAIFAIFIVGAMPVAWYFAELADAPGGIIVSAVFSLVPIAIAVFASMLMKLLQEAIDIKSENDLTI